MPDLSADLPAKLRQLFTGCSGQMAVMAELLHRGINVAVPEVDVGEDIFTVKGSEEKVTRVQVKTANATGQQDGSYFAQFLVPLEQLIATDSSELVYIFAVRYQNRWSDFIVIHRAVLSTLHRENGVGSIIKNAVDKSSTVNLRLVFTQEDVRNKGTSFASHRNAFEPWPPPKALPSDETGE